MKSLWNSDNAKDIVNDALALRVYTSRLLGQEENLVMHGGGNTSVKTTFTDFFDRDIEALFVKGSGWDLKTIEKEGFAPLRLQETRQLAERETLTDDDMVQQLRTIMLNPNAPSPSVEAILHAIIPFKYVDHTHTDAVVTITNTPHGESYIQEIYPDCLVLPYVMPGFILAKQVYDALKEHDLSRYKGIILLHHGVFTYHDSAQDAYENMIELVSRAEAFIEQKSPNISKSHNNASPDHIQLATIRNEVSKVRGKAQVAKLDTSDTARGFAQLENVASLATRGPITPDHVIRTKRIACIIDKDPQESVDAFAKDYTHYFRTNASPELTILDPAPRWAVWKEQGTLAFGSSIKECQIATDIIRHTIKAIQTAETLGGWQALTPKEIFDLEYWVLEQAKLKKKGASQKIHEGKIALVTGAASGIGLATALELHTQGAVVVGLDINPQVTSSLNKPDFVGKQCDLTDEQALQTCIQEVVRAFGGLDILVCNAGIFSTGQTIDQLDETWDRTVAINLTATQRLLKHAIPYLKLGISPSIIIMGSRNYAAPGAGASAYSVSKAGVTQLGRVAALELAKDKVRVNIIHPDAVFDTGLWTQETLERSAKRYGISVEEYKTKNLLSSKISATDVATLVSTVAGPTFSATTGAQIPIDGGNERVI